MRNALVFRIAMWSSAGFLISAGWGLYFASTSKSLPIEPIAYALASLTQPTAAAALQLKLIHQLGLAWVVASNAVTYALLGLMVEKIRQHYRTAT